MSVAPDVTRAHVEEELAATGPWEQRHGWTLRWDAASLLLTVSMTSKVDREVYIAELALDSYRAVPPLIEFRHPLTGERGSRRCYPGGGRGYFHTHPVICAPWNRKAYAAHGGPHGDWVLANWASLRPNHARLGDILVLVQDLLDDRDGYSGRMER